MSELTCTIDKMDLTDLYRILLTTAVAYTFFSASQETFSKTDHILDKVKLKQIQNKLK
jgi:hypothetical protein